MGDTDKPPLEPILLLAACEHAQLGDMELNLILLGSPL